MTLFHVDGAKFTLTLHGATVNNKAQTVEITLECGHQESRVSSVAHQKKAKANSGFTVIFRTIPMALTLYLTTTIQQSFIGRSPLLARK